MRDAFRAVVEFNAKAGHKPPVGGPASPSRDAAALQRMLLREEYSELMTALESTRDETQTSGSALAAIADGLADLIYVALGTAYHYGIDLPQVWEAVCEANAAKVGPGSTKRADGKILKPANWRHPDIEDLIDAQPAISDTYGDLING